MLLQRILVRASIFARMSPEQKTELVELMEDMDYVVGFCGDGANDCGALRCADMGLSLSEAEASIAAPFTSKKPTISAVITLLREGTMILLYAFTHFVGRASLVTSFQCFKFMAIYALILSSAVVIMYRIDTGMGDFQYLYIDLFIVLPLSFLMARTPPTKYVAYVPY